MTRKNRTALLTLFLLFLTTTYAIENLTAASDIVDPLSCRRCHDTVRFDPPPIDAKMVHEAHVGGFPMIGDALKHPRMENLVNPIATDMSDCGACHSNLIDTECVICHIGPHIEEKDCTRVGCHGAWAPRPELAVLPRAYTIINFYFTPDCIQIGKSLTISGRLFAFPLEKEELGRGVVEEGVPNRVVTLYYRPLFVGSPLLFNITRMEEEAWTKIADVKTLDDGSFSYVWKGAATLPEGSYELKAVFTGDKDYSPSEGYTIFNITPYVLTITISPTVYLGRPTTISGKLTTVDGTPLGGKIVEIQCLSVLNGFYSQLFLTATTTKPDGSYTLGWTPTITGNYTLIANYMMPEWKLPILAYASINLVVALFEEQHLFFVSSNSTVSALAFDSVARELSFTVSGPTGTAGYVEVSIAKSLVANAYDLKVYFDGRELSYNVASADDLWIIHFTYLHSVHTVRIVLGPPPSAVQILVSTMPYIALGVAVVIIIVAMFKKRKPILKAFSG